MNNFVNDKTEISMISLNCVLSEKNKINSHALNTSVCCENASNRFIRGVC